MVKKVMSFSIAVVNTFTGSLALLIRIKPKITLDTSKSVGPNLIFSRKVPPYLNYILILAQQDENATPTSKNLL